MPIVETELSRSRANDRLGESRPEQWRGWYPDWSPAFVGALAAFSMVLLFGLAALALGAHLIGPENRVVDLKKVSYGALFFSVFGSFLAFVVGGWTAGKCAGVYHSEPAILLGAVTFLLTVPLIVVVASLGASNHLGGWYGGLGASPTTAPYVRPEYSGASATAEDAAAYRADLAEYNKNVKQWKEDAPKVTRNTALGTITALLLGLAGSVVGGWMASGEPMHFGHHRTRKPIYRAV